MLWARDFLIAETTRDGVIQAVTVTCNLHTCEGRRCNKWVGVGGTNSHGEDMDIAAAEHRIKEWCVRGYDIQDGECAVKEHMKPRPRNWRASDLRPLETLEGLIRQW